MKTEKSVSRFLLIFKLSLCFILLSATCNVFAGYYFVYTSVPDESCSDDCYQPIIHRYHHPHAMQKYKVAHPSHSHCQCADVSTCNKCHTHSGYQSRDYVVYQADPDDAFSSSETYENTYEETPGPSMDTCTADDTE